MQAANPVVMSRCVISADQEISCFYRTQRFIVSSQKRSGPLHFMIFLSGNYDCLKYCNTF
jgi:hypothetical protein